MEEDILKIIVIILVVVLIGNIILLALGKIKELVFWVIIIIIGIFSFKVVPKIRNS